MLNKIKNIWNEIFPLNWFFLIAATALALLAYWTMQQEQKRYEECVSHCEKIENNDMKQYCLSSCVSDTKSKYVYMPMPM